MFSAEPDGRPGVLPLSGPSRRRAAVELVLLQLGYLLFLLPWGLFATGGDGRLGEELDYGAAVALLYGWLSYPLVTVNTTVAAWVLFGVRRLEVARWVNRIPLVWVLVGVVLMLWIWHAA